MIKKVDVEERRELLDDVELHSSKDVAKFVGEVLDGAVLSSDDEIEASRERIRSYVRAQEIICAGIEPICQLLTEMPCQGLTVERDESGAASMSCGNRAALEAFDQLLHAYL